MLPAHGLVAAYVPLPTEVPLQALFAFLGARLALVRTRADHGLAWVTWDGAAPLLPDALGMPAPAGPPADDAQVTAVLVPGLAFSADGRRLGRGKGCYDRTLARIPAALRVAITWEHCLYASVPTAAHDERVDLIITASRQHPTGARPALIPR
ncbi:MAG: 5-formyltetrahydrofolate cyclo-ligase [Deltaproteobacteria bacterium]|nr:5-formyltetrahydrofolate cyclo-ligase [Deltaproteobacteria bacterium]